MQNAQSATSTIPTAMASSSSLEAEYQTIPLDDEKPECSNAIQYLYNACKSTFTQVKGSFSAEGLNMVRSLLGMESFLCLMTLLRNAGTVFFTLLFDAFARRI